MFLRVQLTITHISLDNGLAPNRRQAIIWSNAAQSIEAYMMRWVKETYSFLYVGRRLIVVPVAFAMYSLTWYYHAFSCCCVLVMDLIINAYCWHFVFCKFSAFVNNTFSHARNIRFVMSIQLAIIYLLVSRSLCMVNFNYLYNEMILWMLAATGPPFTTLLTLFVSYFPFSIMFQKCICWSDSVNKWCGGCPSKVVSWMYQGSHIYPIFSSLCSEIYGFYISTPTTPHCHLSLVIWIYFLRQAVYFTAPLFVDNDELACKACK